MNLFIDGDAFPNLLKPVVYRAIQRLALTTYVVSNKRINIGISEHINYIMVNSGADEADDRIVEMVKEGDLVITSDIPLADRVISKNAFVIDHRGRTFDADNIKQALAIRDLMQEIRDSGQATKGPAPFGQKDVREFAGGFNQFLRRQKL